MKQTICGTQYILHGLIYKPGGHFVSWTAKDLTKDLTGFDADTLNSGSRSRFTNSSPCAMGQIYILIYRKKDIDEKLFDGYDTDIIPAAPPLHSNSGYLGEKFHLVANDSIVQIEITNQDITADHTFKGKVTAVVNAANKSMRHGGGVCGAIWKACGSRLKRYCPVANRFWTIILLEIKFATIKIQVVCLF